MRTANTSYKQNGVPVSIPSGSYGIAHLTVHQYEYPKGHPCHNCPYIIKIVNPLCVAEVAHIFFAAIRVVYNLVSDPAVMLKALEIFDPALHPI